MKIKLFAILLLLRRIFRLLCGVVKSAYRSIGGSDTFATRFTRVHGPHNRDSVTGMGLAQTLFFGAILIMIIWFLVFFSLEKASINKIKTFQTCVENGFPVQESFPRRCITPDGRFFTENTEQIPQPTHSLIVVDSPHAGDIVSSPLKVSGEARGFWFFEASFPVELQNEKGEVLVVGIAQAQSEWMTKEFVPFTVTLSFVNPVVQNGNLVLKKDNPSGLLENDDQIIIPVIIGISN